jgi:pyrimidine deaminase RibD-like protein
MSDEEIFIKRCLKLACLAEGKTSPNPMVGAVVL